MREDGRNMRKLVREALRIYLEERELRRQERLERLCSRQAKVEDTKGTEQASERHDLIPAALYAKVSSGHRYVGLSVAAQLRALRDYSDKNGYLVALSRLSCKPFAGRCSFSASAPSHGRAFEYHRAGSPHHRVKLLLPGHRHW